MKKILLIGFLWLCVFSARGQQVAINEFMSANNANATDEDGDHSDWIELYNSGATSVSLSGYGLSDDASLPFKWTFPDISLPSKGFLLVFASDKNRLSGPYVHTNFKISASGETLQLTDANGTVLSSIPPLALAENTSYGSQPDGSNNRVVFVTNATPGTSNPASGNSDVPKPPTFSQKAGFYTNSFSLTLSSSQVGATIRYTLDGSEPTESSPLYSAPLPIKSRAGEANVLSLIPTNQVAIGPSTYYPPKSEVFKATVVRARAFLPDAPASEVITQTYFIDPQIASRYPLPVISISTNQDNFFGGKNGIYVPGDDFNGDNDRSGNYFQRGEAWERAASLEFFDTDRSKGFSQQVGVRIHGSASRVDPQKSLRIYADKKYGKATVDYALFPDKPISQFKRFVLRNAANDRSYAFLRDVFIQSLVKDLNIDAQASRPAIVFLNGEYWGIHHVQERIDKYYLASNHAVEPSKVDLLEMDREVIEGDATQYQQLIDYIKSHDMRENVNLDTVAKRLDVDEFINYQAAEIYAANIDWPGNNLDYWRPQTANGKWRWIFYDLDFGFGLSGDSYFERDMLAYATEPNGPTFPRPSSANTPYGTFLLRSLLENESFKNRFINRFADLLNTHFKTERVLEKLEQTRATLAPSMPEHIARWSAPASITDWNSFLDVIRTFANQRPTYQRQHIANYFSLSGTAKLTVDVSNASQGHVQVNTLVIDENTAGITNSPYPWEGTYFQQIPVHLTALPLPGFTFLGWSDASLPQSASIDVVLQNDLNVKALFGPEPSPIFTQPAAFDLSKGTFSFTQWTSTAPATTYPANMVFHRTDTQHPNLASVTTTNYLNAYDLSTDSRVNGLGTDGFSFINTNNNGNLGAAVLALNATNRTNLVVNWTGGTVSPNDRTYAIRLQYRIGTNAWADVPGPVEYVRNATAGHYQKFTTNLSSLTGNAVDDQPLLSLRWKYYLVSGTTGDGAELRVNDISVTSTATRVDATQLAIISINGNRPASKGMAFSVIVEAQDEAGNPQPVTIPTGLTLSLQTGSGTFAGTLTATIPTAQTRITLSGLSYSIAEENVVIKATRTNGNALLAGSSLPFAVLAPATKLAFVDDYPFGGAGMPYRPFSVVAKRADNSVDLNFTGNVTVAIDSGNGSLAGTLTRSFVAGVADFNGLVFNSGGKYRLSANTTGLTKATSSATIKIAGLIEVLTPQYIQGQNGSNDKRVPFAFRATLTNLNANAKYRYFNQLILPTDDITTNGAGNAIFAQEGGFVRTSEVSVESAGQYGEFTTDANGSYTGWFITEPTGNSRFTPGNQLKLRLVLNDGGGGSDPFFRLTTSTLVKVLTFGTDATTATGLLGQSCATETNMIALYNQADGSNRPLTATLIENDGSENSVTNHYAAFYSNQVDGLAGVWGTLIPNNLPNGVRRIEQRSLTDGSIVNAATSANGNWGTISTVNPRKGLQALVIPTEMATLAETPKITQQGQELVSSSERGNQWYRNDTLLVGATLQRLAPTRGGSYKVLVNGSVCPGNFSTSLNFTVTGLPEDLTHALHVFPNPTDGQFQVTFHSPAATQVEIRVLDVLGQEIRQHTLQNPSGEYDFPMNLSAHSTGLYLLQIRYNDQVITRKVVLQR